MTSANNNQEDSSAKLNNDTLAEQVNSASIMCLESLRRDKAFVDTSDVGVGASSLFVQKDNEEDDEEPLVHTPPLVCALPPVVFINQGNPFTRGSSHYFPGNQEDSAEPSRGIENNAIC